MVAKVKAVKEVQAAKINVNVLILIIYAAV